jgi:RNA polymerase sigma-70 factor (ECF subfamily)
VVLAENTTYLSHAPALERLKGPDPGVAAEELSEEQLVQWVRDGDIKAFEILVGRYQQRVMRLALSILKDPMEAEEVVQDVFFAVFEKIDTFRGEASLSTWIHRIAVNAALLRKRRDKSGSNVSLDEAMPRFDDKGSVVERTVDWSVQGRDPVLEEESRKVIQTAIGHLDSKYQTVFTLRDVEGFSIESTARMLDLGIPAVKTRLHRARLYLRKELAGYFEKKA